MDYKEKLRLAKEALDYGSYDKETIEYIFPELKESEDERIRQLLIRFVKYDMPNNYSDDFSKEDCLAWLEKQDKNKDILEDAILDSNENGLIAETLRYKKEKQGEQKKSYDTCASSMMDNKKSPYGEKRDFGYFEEKSADKVEPKFKPSDWIVFNGLTLYIKEVVKGYYRTTSIGGISNSYDWDIDNVARLWTIQDAKCGDVLSDGSTIFIFKDLLSDGSVMSYCDYDTNSGESDAFCPLSVNLMCLKITPATKEQCDTLEKTMADTRYTFDFEKKELRKIEQKPAWSEEDNRILSTLTKYLEEHGGGIDGWECSFLSKWLKSIKDRVQPQSTEWSEEDDRMMNDTLATVDWYAGKHKNISVKVGNWLKSLKERVQPQPKQEWSEDDESNISELCSFITESYSKEDASGLRQWLKSLRPQNRWKPSDEQMDALDAAVSSLQSTALESLYNDLKELRDEK